MPAEIIAIAPRSPAAKTKIAPGDVLLSINGNEINDVLDYRFHAAERKLTLVLQRGEKDYHIRLRKEEYDDLGLEFAEGLMDSQRHCRNKCVFCFIDQLPSGLRESLYFKDDDARLGFLFGNYITLTNLNAREVQRIIAMRLSPINVSVHTTNALLRQRMMGNPGAGDSLRHLQEFAAAGLEINAQLVLCPGWNDGEELRRSLQDLLTLPTLCSVAAVPVGLTKYREGLADLHPFTAKEAQSVLTIFDSMRQLAAEHPQCPGLCASDEFFLLAGKEPPGPAYYGDFRQLENGVGLWSSLKQDVLEALPHAELRISNYKRKQTLATGVAAEPLMRLLVDEMKKIWHTIDIHVCCIENRFLGEHITVAGLLTGQDVIAQLQGKPLGARLLLPAVMFNHDGLTLDGMTAADISQVLGVPVHAVKNDADALIEAILSIDNIPE